jgi:glucose-1-phosphatase
MRLQNILLDLGGVLYDIDIDRTMERYRALARQGSTTLHYQSERPLPWFSRLDRGEIDIDTFAHGLKQAHNLQADIATIKQIWLELLLGVFPGRTESVTQLAPHYRLALLSNTSRYHHDHYRPACAEMFAQMDHLFFSFEMGLTKPDPVIYQRALSQAGWRAEETLFMDDSQRNLQAAAQLGIQTAWIDHPAQFDAWVERLLAQAKNPT